MFNRTIVLTFFAFLVLSGIIFWLYLKEDLIKDDLSLNSEPSVDIQNFERVSWSSKKNVGLDFNISIPNNDYLDLSVFANSEMLQDLTLGFKSLAAMKDFIIEAKKNGIQIRDQLDQVSMVRVRIRDLTKAAHFMDQWDEEIEPQYNFRVRTPELPRAEFLDNEKGFGANANQWMGTPEERKEWGRGIKVAILDSGIDRRNSNLDGVQIQEIDLIGGSDMSRGHGTAIASIIAGNEKGQLGLSPSASLLSIRVLDSQGKGDSFTVAKGIIKAADQGAQVINLSLGGSSGGTVLKNAIEYAHQKGAVVVAAVGNEGVEGVSYPAKFEKVIGVTSVDSNGRQSSFANYGEGVDIAAPGVGVFTAWENEEMVSFSGTSTATAFVSGALAAELSKNPNLSSDQVLDIIYKYSNESEKPGFDQYTGNGILNIGRIENRDVPNIHDGAIVGYYFEPENLAGGTTPFLVSVQNQGTSWLNNVNLKVEYRGVVKNFLFNNLNPGETRSEQLFLDGSNGEGKGVKISSSLTINGYQDQNIQNNTRVSTILLP
jgi:thermitase